jgi:MFS family permease
MSALGIGGFSGGFLGGAASDHLGRKITTTLCFIGAAGSVYLLIHLGDSFWATHAQGLAANAAPVDLGDQFWVFYGALFLVSVFTFGVLAVMTGPVPTEGVSPTMIAAAVGLVSGTGEIFGAGVGPPLAGYVADKYGIQNILNVGLVGVIIGILVSLFLRETAPRKLAAAASSERH